ncbi:hypothetical protein JVT61DRAFT_7561 [Boletus reticuloceps]|uniref:Uncharacterized protein n=1 Tax=Boletus reticuloceps TaxID=495285 RepID=A0A8I2YIN2_9AGAM|nr:hypothetical protein JVT61DRAFT_7561 [Boletus reticuloceps]
MIRIGEVQFFAQLAETSPDGRSFFNNIAILKLYSEPDQDILKESFQVVATSTFLNSITILDVKAIYSVVAMVPHQIHLLSGFEEERFCMIEKPGLNVSDLGVAYDLNEDDNNTDINTE